MPTFYENKQLVTPGDLLAEGNYVAGENAYAEDGKIYSTQLGLVDYEEQRVHVVALRAFYIPYIGDTVIGKVVDVGFSGWMLDINAPYLAMLRASDVLDRPFKPQKNDLFSIFNIGDLIIAKVVAYNRTRDPPLLTSYYAESLNCSVSKAYGAVKGFGVIRREEWRADGSWSTIVELPAGLYGPFLEKLGEITRGNLQAKLIE